MNLHISQVVENDQFYVKLEISEDFKDFVWQELKKSIKQFQDIPFKDEGENSIVAEWVSFLSILHDLDDLREINDFQISYSDDAKDKIIETINNQNLLTSENFNINLTNSDIENLKNLGFSKIKLTEFQIRDLKALLRLSNGANFSVQGSGKTAVTLATHLILRNNKKTNVNSLLVVSPKNAFLGWEDGFDDCLDDDCVMKKEGLTELTGTRNAIIKKLNSGAKNFIINYEKLITMSNLISGFVQKNRVHFVLDESHKIKSENAQRSQAILNIAYRLQFIRKDILSGTPAPNKLEDINTQYQFLYPGPEYTGDRFWVRTTKNELNLPEPKIKMVNVDMSEPQMALYAKVLNPLLATLNNDSAINYSNSRDIRQSIIRLIQISSNPVLVTRRQEEEGNITLGENIDFNIHRALIKEEKEGGSAKIRAACAEARRLAKLGKKTVIWSYFRWNIEYIGKYLLNDLNAEYIHGGVEMGENDEELESRKYKIKKFKDKNSDCMVLVANYASCAEGISLHHVCHNAIYIDRSFQADQYLQSVDRICRLGNNDEKNIIILQNKIPETLKNIDLAVNHALQRKIENMGRFLNDPDLIQMSLNESEGIQPIDENISNSDL
ncbi:SNF2-related protein, partial [Candidatus Pelagibacter ubique]|nr:SNF2-related protein [Candidatus Pelagibacter ubique]